MTFEDIKVNSRVFLDDEKTISDTGDYNFKVGRIRDLSFEDGSKLILCELENEENFKLILARKSIGDLQDFKIYNYMDFFVEGSREDHSISNPWLFENSKFAEVIEGDDGVYIRKKLPEVSHDGDHNCFVAEYVTQAVLDNDELLIIETGDSANGWIEFYEGRVVAETAFTVEF
jgi:hypothetical protein